MTQPAVAIELPGLSALVKALAKTAKEALSREISSRTERWEVCRQLCVYAQRPEVRAEAAKLNLTISGERRPGREKEPHRVAMEALSRVSGVSFKSLERWMGDWFKFATRANVQRHLETEVEKHIRAAAKEEGLTVEAWLEALYEKDAPETQEKDPAKIVESGVKKILKPFTTDQGFRVNPNAFRILIDGLNPLFEVHGVIIASARVRAKRRRTA